MFSAAVLGALQNQFHRLQESARGISIPENLKHNISANLGNVRSFVGDFVPAARDADAADQPLDVAGVTSSASAPHAGAASPAQEAVASGRGANGSKSAASAAVDQPTDSAAVPTHAGHEDASLQHSDADGPAELDADPDLEAYLKVLRRLQVHAVYFQICHAWDDFALQPVLARPELNCSLVVSPAGDGGQRTR
jgi:hypothetical protein